MLHNTRSRVLFGLATALVSLGTALAIAQPRYDATWHALVPNGAPVAAQTGDRILIRPLIAGRITITAYPFTVAQISGAPKRPADFRSDGADTYELSDDRDGALDVTLLSLRPAISPLVVALLLLLASIGVFYALAQLSGQMKLRLQWEPVPLALVACASFALFLLVPHYIHNDTFGGGLRWGYLGWGYVDSVSAIPRALANGGLVGLAGVPSNLKPIVYPLLTSLFTIFASPLSAAIVISAFMNAVATAGIAQLGSMLLDRWAGLCAAVLFTFAPVTLAYATAFYAETAFLAALLWAAVFIINGLRSSSRSSLLIGAIVGSFAVASKTLDAAVLYAAALLFLMLAARLAWKVALSVAILSSFAAVVVTILAWPFLWIDSLERIRLALFGRVLFDRYAHLSEPILQRVGNVIGQTIAHTDPITILLVAVAILWAGVHRNRVIPWLLAGALAGMAFVLPTALYLQHYWFYIVPFAQLIAAYPLIALATRFRAPVLACLGAATLAWSSLYFPYPAMATIGCSNFDCSARRWGVSEPVYGLAEAAHWIRQHIPRRAVIATLVAPHVLQVELPGYRVVDLRLPDDAAAQADALRSARIDYLVTNSWSKDTFRESVAAPQLRRLWSSSARTGSAAVFRVAIAHRHLDLLDAPPPSEAVSLAGASRRIAVFPKTWSYAAFPGGRQVIVLNEERYPLRDFVSLLKLGGGAIVLRRGDRWPSALAYERPINQNADAAAFALPTLSGSRVIQQVTLKPSVIGLGDKTRTTFAGEITPRMRFAPLPNVLTLDLRSGDRNAQPEDFWMRATCQKRSVALHGLSISATEARGYATSASPLRDCMQKHLPIAAYVAVRGDVRRSVHTTLALRLEQ